MRQRITVGQIAKALRCHEQTARAYLHEVNASIDRRTSDLAEAVDPTTLVALCRRHAGSVTERRLVPLLATARR